MAAIKDFNWNKRVKGALDRTEFMALSTIDKDGSWICPVQFSYDERLRLYFKSMPKARHMKNIGDNPRVSIAIFSTNRLPDGGVTGIQLLGRARILHAREDIENAAKHHYRRKDKDADYRSRIDEHVGENAAWNFVEVAPREAWLFDTRFFDEERVGRQQIPLDLKFHP